ncbi:MAG: hypothetical protein D6781_02185 [Verrucomicrobia bacterium]|nr:MAG: hypothetical protein D6781_02185 [Verrucomicrobiota bacterium]
MNLAPLRYRRVLSDHGGPIETIDCGSTTVMGVRMFQANAFLQSGLRTGVTRNVVFGNPDGSGTARRQLVARHKAVSEALERWAYDVSSQGPERSRYGFDVDSSSNGMAAYPGLVGVQARWLAMAEAAERFSLIGWWSGALDAQPRGEAWPGVEVWELENPFTDHTVVLMHAMADEGVHAYAHGAAGSFQDACACAAVELSRAQWVLRRYTRKSRYGTPPPVKNNFECRCLHFASELGHAEFRNRLRIRKWRQVEPRVVFDGEIVGPWSEYATVWRVALEPPSPQFLDPKTMFFFW